MCAGRETVFAHSSTAATVGPVGKASAQAVPYSISVATPAVLSDVTEYVVVLRLSREIPGYSHH